MWQNAEMPKVTTDIRKPKVCFRGFFKAERLKIAGNVTVWRYCCGLEGVQEAIEVTCWLQEFHTCNVELKLKRT